MSKEAHATAARLRIELASKKYDDVIESALTRLFNASQPERRRALAAEYGGVLRMIRSKARIMFASALMNELHITPTITVAKYVMRTAFDEAVGSDALLENFADGERTAAEKVMGEARAILATETAATTIANFSEAYEEYLKALNDRATKIKALVAS